MGVIQKVSKEFLAECERLWKEQGTYRFFECKFKKAGGSSLKIKALVAVPHADRTRRIYAHKLGYECAFITRLVDPDNFDYPRFECLHEETFVSPSKDHIIWTFTLAPSDT